MQSALAIVCGWITSSQVNSECPYLRYGTYNYRAVIPHQHARPIGLSIIIPPKTVIINFWWVYSRGCTLTGLVPTRCVDPDYRYRPAVPRLL